MVINNTSHTKRCDSRCENFNGYQKSCMYRSPIEESASDYRWKMYKMRDDKQHEKKTFKKDKTVKIELIQEKGFTVNFGRCNRDEIITRSEKIKPKVRRMSAGGVL